MTKQLILHIGDPKTGTSSIQTALSQELVETEDRIIPWTNMNAISLANSLKDESDEGRRNRSKKISDWYRSSSSGNFVISAENFSMVPPRNVRKMLEESIPESLGSVRIISYVRPHLSRCVAAFIQRTKKGLNFRDFPDFCEHIKTQKTLNYDERFSQWKDEFGTNFNLRPYMRSELASGDVVVDFFHAILGGADFKILKDLKVNPTVGLKTLSGMRYVLEFLSSNGVDARDRGSIGGAVARKVAEIGSATDLPVAIDRVSAKKLADFYRQDARDLDEKFFGRSIMSDALEASVHGAADEPIMLTPETYFSSHKLDCLTDISRELTKLPHGVLNAWRIQDQSIRGQSKISVVKKMRIEKNRSQIERLDRIISEISQAICR